jgi:hypothetical protein
VGFPAAGRDVCKGRASVNFFNGFFEILFDYKRIMVNNPTRRILCILTGTWTLAWFRMGSVGVQIKVLKLAEGRKPYEAVNIVKLCR